MAPSPRPRTEGRDPSVRRIRRLPSSAPGPRDASPSTWTRAGLPWTPHWMGLRARRQAYPWGQAPNHVGPRYLVPVAASASILVLQPYALSEVGTRSNNEDAVFASPRLVAVADGVGGAAAGELASHLAILKMVALDKRRLLQPLDRELAAAVADANDLISFAAFHEPRHQGMAT